MHHTGDLKGAILHASALVKPGGIFAFALYRRVFLDPLWKIEKKWYAFTSKQSQYIARIIYKCMLHITLILKGKSLRQYKHNRLLNRGMDLDHDIHDWLGGWPYESISPKEVNMQLCSLYFNLLSSPPSKPSRISALGFVGSGCDEYVYQKKLTTN